MARQLGALAARYLDERIAGPCHRRGRLGLNRLPCRDQRLLSAQAGHLRRAAHGERRRGHPGYRWRSGRLAAGPRPGWAKVYYLHAPMVVTDAGRAGRAAARSAHSQDAGDGAARQCAPGLGRGGDTGVGHLPGRLPERDGSRIHPGPGRRRRHLRRVLPADGSPCSLELEERTIAAGGDAMRASALRVGVGWGAAKALPSIGRDPRRLINILVTDEECAREMPATLFEQSAPRRRARRSPAWPSFRHVRARSVAGCGSDDSVANSVSRSTTGLQRRKEMDIDLLVEPVVARGASGPARTTSVVPVIARRGGRDRGIPTGGRARPARRRRGWSRRPIERAGRGAPRTSAMIWHQSGEREPPPRMTCSPSASRSRRRSPPWPAGARRRFHRGWRDRDDAGGAPSSSRRPAGRGRVPVGVHDVVPIGDEHQPARAREQRPSASRS